MPVRRAEAAVCAVLLALLAVIYLPSLGKGFIRDDFAWIRTASVSSVEETGRFFQHADGFYRPVVSLSFAANRALFGLQPSGYALTNVVLLLLCGGAIILLARAFGLPPMAGVIAAGLWLLNPHGINTTLLWISGRTALLLTLFSVLAAVAFKSGRPWLAAPFALLAMLSKEEAVVLPIVFFTWAAIAPPDRPGTAGVRRLARALSSTWVCFAALAAYLWLRNGSGAMTPWAAPAAYRFTSSPVRIGRNVLEYLDRTCTFPVLLLGVAGLLGAVRWRALAGRRPLLLELAAWTLGLFAITVFLPVRSGLYVLAPGVGVVVVAGAWLADSAAGLERRRLRRVAATIGVLFLLSVPIYWARNTPNARRAALATAVMQEIGPILRTLPAGKVLVIQDDRQGPATVEDAFGPLANEAAAVYSGRADVGLWLDPPPFDIAVAGVAPPEAGRIGAVFGLRAGRLERVR